MKEVYCTNCKRFLCKLFSGELEIKCPKCKHVNHIEVTSYTKMLTASPEQDIITT